MTQYSLAISPCPNDTFIFHALLHGLINTQELSFHSYYHDVEELNRSAMKNTYDITKLSFHAYLYLQNEYQLLKAGAALGFGCGPLVISQGDVNFENATVAIPGHYTTAHLLLKLWAPRVKSIEIMTFDEIMPAVAQGQVDAGVIIHESRFVYPQYGLKQVVDLGSWWESETGLPIPLGCIAVKKSMDPAHAQRISAYIKESIEWAQKYPQTSADYIRSHAREMDDDVINQHIRLYVNEYSLDFKDAGFRALDELEKRARKEGLL